MPGGALKPTVATARADGDCYMSAVNARAAASADATHSSAATSRLEEPLAVRVLNDAPDSAD